jgi:hypothetical protein
MSWTCALHVLLAVIGVLTGYASVKLQGSVLGSGAAGMACAAMALLLGDTFPWRVRCALHMYGAS